MVTKATDEKNSKNLSILKPYKTVLPTYINYQRYKTTFVLLPIFISQKKIEEETNILKMLTLKPLKPSEIIF